MPIIAESFFLPDVLKAERENEAKNEAPCPKYEAEGIRRAKAVEKKASMLDLAEAKAKRMSRRTIQVEDAEKKEFLSKMLQGEEGSELSKDLASFFDLDSTETLQEVPAPVSKNNSEDTLEAVYDYPVQEITEEDKQAGKGWSKELNRIADSMSDTSTAPTSRSSTPKESLDEIKEV